LQAARLLNGEDIEFWLIGDNHEASGRTDLLSHCNGPRVKLMPWMLPYQLRDKIGEADVCLGIFGTSDKAKRVIPGKAFLALAMGKPLITGDSPAARELFEDGKNAILCEMGSAGALADAICRLRKDAVLRRRIGEEGRQLFQKQCRPAVLGLRLARRIRETLKRKETGSIEMCERHHT
jgi:glycosyltransferase involved in cell wall biosynthesis